MRRHHVVTTGLLVLLGVTALTACATMSSTPPSLYDRLKVTDQYGIPRAGRDAIALVVDDFVANLISDARVNARFKALKPADVPRVKSNLADQLCEAAGGPCSYYGKDMKTVHAGMKITEAEWNATFEDLVKALDKNKIPDKEKSELLGVLGPMKKDIVGQ
jgi:hemoglobin